MMGALIITVVLMGSIFLGFMTSIEKVPTTSIDYEYVTDGTSLFDYTQSPEYVDYSPNINYTHYTGSLAMAQGGTGSNFYTTGVNFTKADKVNQYRVFSEPIHETVSFNLSSYTYNSYVDNSTSSHKIFIGATEKTVGGGTYYDGSVYTTAPKIITLKTLIDSDPDNFNQPASNVVFKMDKTVWVMWGANFQWTTLVTLGSTEGTYVWAHTSESACDAGPSQIDYEARYIPSEGKVTLYEYTTSKTVFTTTDPSQIYLIYGGTYTGPDGYAPTGIMEAQVDNPDPATYMDVSQGVTHGDRVVYWTNGYDLGKVTMLLDARDGTSTSLNVSDERGSKGICTVRYGSAGGYVLYDVAADEAKVLGKWDMALLEIDLRAGEVKLSGVNNPTSMVDYTASEYSVTGSFTPGATKILTLYNGKGWKMSVNATTVYMDTYSNLMQDPNVNLSSYFSTAEYVRLNFDSFAYYGDSITINGTTYDVVDGKITVDIGNGRTRSFDLTNMLVTWEKDKHVYLSFTNSNTKIDLGETTTRTLSMGGDWYFDAAIYQGKEVVGSEYKWDAGTWSFTESGFYIIFLGLLILAACVIKATRGLDLLSIVILCGAGLIGFILLG